MDKTKRAFQKFVDAATDLAESVKRNIQKDGYIDDRTAKAVNLYIIAMNELANLQDEMLELEDENETDQKLN